MPCYLFTWHAYGSWLPDRPKGYIHWSRGYEPTNVAMAQRYRQQQKQTTVEFDVPIQLAMIEELLKAATLQRFRLHFVATEKTHIHASVSWIDRRNWKQLRRSIRRSLTDKFNQHQHRKWFSRGGDAKQVKDRKHFNYLRTTYLPSHSGWKWCAKRGLFK